MDLLLAQVGQFPAVVQGHFVKQLGDDELVVRLVVGGQSRLATIGIISALKHPVC